MTATLEDVETLLENKQYLDCQRCALNTQLGRRILNAHCPDCKSWGVMPNPVYVSAAQRAGLPIPRPMEEVKIEELNKMEAALKEASRQMHQQGIRVDQTYLDKLVYGTRRGS